MKFGSLDDGEYAECNGRNLVELCKMFLIEGESFDFMLLYHDQDTLYAGKGCVEMHDFHTAAMMYLTGHGIEARTHAHTEIAHFLMQCMTSAWKAPGLQLRAPQS